METLTLDKSKVDNDIAGLKQQIQARASEVCSADPTFCALNAQLQLLEKLNGYESKKENEDE